MYYYSTISKVHFRFLKAYAIFKRENFQSGSFSLQIEIDGFFQITFQRLGGTIKQAFPHFNVIYLIFHTTFLLKRVACSWKCSRHVTLFAVHKQSGIEFTTLLPQNVGH